jgi:YHS domain-containing protein
MVKSTLIAVAAAVALSTTALANHCCPSHAAPAAAGDGESAKSAKQATKKRAKADKTTATVSAENVKAVGNTHCPISGNDVASTESGAKLVYAGHEVGLCCSGCKKKFMENAEANLKKAQEDARQ